MNAWPRVSCLLLLSAAGITTAPAQSGSTFPTTFPATVPTVETILSRMAQARTENRARLRPYQLTRDYKLFGKERLTTKAEVVAGITFVPPDLKQYAIQHANGMGLGEKIVRLMLDSETGIAKNYSQTDMTAANYDFRLVREEELSGQRCYVLEMIPRRKDKILLRGNIWVDSTTYLLRRTEGEPGKPPSWWLKDARIVLVYGDVGGMWLQTGSESMANVRFLGPHTMVSRDVDYKFSQTAAQILIRPGQKLTPSQ